MAKYKRKQFFINRELQGKYMLSFAIPMFSLLIFFAVLFYFALVRGLDGSLDMLNQDVTEQITFSLEGKSNPSAEDYEFALESVKSTITGFAQDEGKRAAVQQLLFWIIIPGFVLLMVQVLLLTIFFSHKLAGPVYRLEIAMNRVIDGDYSERVKLRDGDQLMNLAELLNEVIEKSGESIQGLNAASTDAEKLEIVEKLTFDLDSKQ
jgi:methyl-accepting chemotaxis protein